MVPICYSVAWVVLPATNKIKRLHLNDVTAFLLNDNKMITGSLFFLFFYLFSTQVGNSMILPIRWILFQAEFLRSAVR